MVKFHLRGIRNGNWRSLNLLEKGLYACALRLARRRGGIVNAKLLVSLKSIIWKLLATVKRRILQVGEARAKEMLKTLGELRVFVWAPQVKGWLEDLKFMYYLGAMELFAH